MTHIGFTGTQVGMSKPQSDMVRRVIASYMAVSNQVTLHHGDCIGADYQAHHIALGLRVQAIEIHPPSNESKRAFCHAIDNIPTIVTIHPKKPYLDRNKDIVNASSILIGTPKGVVEELRSGTWSTIRYGRAKKITVYTVYGVALTIVYPDGRVVTS